MTEALGLAGTERTLPGPAVRMALLIACERLGIEAAERYSVTQARVLFGYYVSIGPDDALQTVFVSDEDIARRRPA